MPVKRRRDTTKHLRSGRRTSVSAPNYQIRAVERALEVLSAFTATEPEMSLGQLAEKTGLHKATLVRMLRCLQSQGFVRQLPGGSYQLGIKVFQLGSVYYVTHLSVERVARPLMERLVDRWRLTANLAVLDEGQIVYIGIVEPQRALRLQFSVGSRFSVHCTALGKALVADFADEQIDEIIRRHGLARQTEKTMVDPVQFKAHLRLVRERGFSIDEQEAIPNVRCVAAPIRDFRGRTVAAMSLSGSILDLTREVVPEIAADVQEACATISRTLGAEFNLDLAPSRTAGGPVALAASTPDRDA